MTNIKKNSILFSIFLINNFFSQKVWSLQESIEHATKYNLQVVYFQYNEKLETKNLQVIKNGNLPYVGGSMNNYLRFGQTQGFQGSIGKNDNFNNDLNISVNLLLYNAGKLKKQINKKEYDIAVAQYNTDLIKNDVTIQVIQQYLSILLKKEILKINQVSVENAQELYNRAKITTKLETTTRTVLAEAEASLYREKQKLELAEIEIRRSLFVLAQILQLKDYHNFDIEEMEINEKVLKYPFSLEQVVEQAFSHHPQIRLAKSSIKSAEAQTQIVKTDFLPIISLNTGIGTFYYNSLVKDITGIDSMGNIIKEKSLPKQYWSNFYQYVNVSINIPIFNKGNTKIQIEQAKINEDIVKNDLEIKKQELLQNIQKIYFDMDSYYQTLLSAIETEKSSRLALDFAEKSYEIGKTTIYDLNIARNNYINAKSVTIQEKYNYVFSQKILDFYKNNCFVSLHCLQ